ncbi:MAG: ClC family H(+)/Cl(-) exchange transporter [Clostridiaceae bacterium]
MDNKNNTEHTLQKWNNFKIRVIFEGIAIGIITGLLIVAYRFAVDIAIGFTGKAYDFLRINKAYIPFWFIFLALLGIIVGYLVKKEPMISGSGIPQVEGVLLRKLDMNWLKVVVYKFFGGFLGLAAGLSLGREGPSIQMGAAIGQGYSRITKRPKIEEKFLITSGASAGLAAAFNAPLAGVMFSLEEVHKNFSPVVLTTALAASVTADFVTKNFFGLKPIFNLNVTQAIPLIDYPYLIVLGVLIGIAGVVFNKGLLKTQEIYEKQKFIPKRFWPIIPFLTAGVLAFILPEVLGGGHELIISLSEAGKYSILALVVIVVVKYLFTILSYGSSAPGGIFLPLLVIGAIIGAIYGLVITKYFGVDKIYLINIIIISMAAYFAAIVKAPITGMVLLTEMTGSFNHLLSIAFVSIIAYVITDLLGSKPIYESLLERLLSKGTNKFHGDSKNKVIIEIPVCMGSKLQFKKLSEVKWPKHCLIVSLKRGEREIIPKGSTSMYAGDYLIVLANEDESAIIYDRLTSFAEEGDYNNI